MQRIEIEGSQEDESYPAVAAVIVTYNRKKLLRQCLEALNRQTHSITEIIVIDNASTDGTAAMVRSNFPDVTLRSLEENRGGAGGFHEGMRLAASRDVEWVWVMDDDVEPQPDALQRLIGSRAFEKNNTVGLASLKVGENGGIQSAHAGTYDPAWMTRSPSTPKEGETRIQFSSFVGLMVRRTVIETIGLPEEGFFIRDDDVDFSLRLSSVGHVYLVPRSIVVHHNSVATSSSNALTGLIGGRTRPLDQYWKRYYGIRNSILVLYRHTDSIWRRVLGLCMAMAVLFKEVGAVLLRGDQRRKQLSILFAGFGHGVRGKSGHYICPDDFPQRLHPDALHSFQASLHPEDVGLEKKRFSEGKL